MEPPREKGGKREAAGVRMKGGYVPYYGKLPLQASIQVVASAAETSAAAGAGDGGRGKGIGRHRRRREQETGDGGSGEGDIGGGGSRRWGLRPGDGGFCIRPGLRRKPAFLLFKNKNK